MTKVFDLLDLLQGCDPLSADKKAYIDMKMEF